MVLTEFPPRIGGMQAHADQLSRRLADTGHLVEVVTYQPSDAEERHATSDWDLSYPFSVRRCLSRLSYFTNLRVLEREVRRFEPDLIYTSTVFYGALRSRLGIPMVARCVGNDVLRPWIAYPFAFAHRIIASPYLEPRLFRWFRDLTWPEWVELLFRRQRQQILVDSARRHDCIFANSAFTANLLSGIGVEAQRVEVLPGGVDAAAFAPRLLDKPKLRNDLGLPQTAPVLLTACRLVPKKGLSTLFDAFGRLRSHHRGAHLVVAGDGPHRTSMQALTRSMGLVGSIQFVGKVPHGSMPKWFWAADIFVLASREHVHRASGLRDVETMGRVLCEANAAGIPVVATRTGGIPCVVKDDHNGLLVPPDDPEALANAISRIERDASLAARLRACGLEEARARFDWSVLLERHTRVFDGLVERARQSSGATSLAGVRPLLRASIE